MKALYAAPRHSWGGMFEKLQQSLPQYQWQAQEDYQIQSLHDIDVVIPTMSPITAELLRDAPQLKLIQQSGAGLEGVDIQAARLQQIAVANVPTEHSGNADSVAELGIFLMLSLARQAKQIATELAQQHLGHPLGTTLKGKTVGLVGVGGIGKALAKRLKAFEMTLIGVKRHADPKLASQLGMQWCAGMDGLDQLLQESDFLVFSLPDTPQTHHLLTTEKLQQVKPGAFLINLGRGGLIDPDVLLQALRHGPLAGAGLDVFWQEPPDPKHPLFTENLIATPHIGGVTQLSMDGIFAAVVDNLNRLSAGQPLLYRAC
ncbi:NAD(P)-dependent oxidoreductase [Celerinatantimonas sp. YJH-8]|uniref:NAD(P)-dependent oxidoreductase n=1 Tax=Celerinatantimonas sp. YJH-8 TaxID=3228714 RepID=UPI0038CAEE86